MAQDIWRGKNILITGGAGFIGSSLAHALVDAGARVTVLDAMLPLYGGNRFNLSGIESKLTFIHGDIRDQQLIESLVPGVDIIFMMAAQVSYVDSKDQPFLDLDINGRGHLIVLEAVRKLAPKARILFASSRLVYGRILSIPVREDHPTNPLSMYGIHKLLGEKYYRYYCDAFGVSTVSVRIPNPYGPRQQMKHNKYSIVGWFVRQAMQGEEIKIFGDGTQERDYMYIDDIVEAFMRLAHMGEPGDVYNIGTQERVRFVDMVDAVIKEVGSGKKVHVPWPAHYEKNETGNYIADTSKIQALTGWQPQVKLADGISRMVTYYQQFGDRYWERS
jgi:nucleoside-diphosphate-sugar epimerase